MRGRASYQADPLTAAEPPAGDAPGGDLPTPSVVDRLPLPRIWAVSSAVEHCFHTAGATGSIPVPPTIQVNESIASDGAPPGSVRTRIRTLGMKLGSLAARDRTQCRPMRRLPTPHALPGGALRTSRRPCWCASPTGVSGKSRTNQLAARSPCE